MYGRDTLEVKIKTLDKFISQDTGLSPSLESFPGGIPKLTKELPPMISPQQKEQMDGTNQKVGFMVNIMSSSNFFLAIILKGSMQQLFGMIRAIQIIVLAALMNISFPSNAAAFF